MDNHFEESQFRLLDENKALIAERDELRAQVNLLLKACQSYGDMTGEPYALDEADTIVLMTTEQCLNSVKLNAFEEGFRYSCAVYNGSSSQEVISEAVRIHGDLLNESTR